MRRIVAGLAALSLATAAFAQASPQVIGVTSAVVREATLSNARIATPRAITLRERIALADLIQTGKQSQVQLMLLDRSVFSIGANARLRIDRFVHDPAAGRAMGASVAKGAFRFMSGRPARQNASTVSTPVATIGIRGTVFDGAVGKTAIDVARGEVVRASVRDADPETATLVVLRGPGAGTQGLAAPGAISVTAGGATVDLNAPMLAAFVPRAGARPIGPFVLSSPGLRLLQDAIFPAQARKGGSGKALGILAGIGAVAAGAAILGGGDRNSNDDIQPPGNSTTGP